MGFPPDCMLGKANPLRRAGWWWWGSGFGGRWSVWCGGCGMGMSVWGRFVGWV